MAAKKPSKSARKPRRPSDAVLTQRLVDVLKAIHVWQGGTQSQVVEEGGGVTLPAYGSHYFYKGGDLFVREEVIDYTKKRMPKTIMTFKASYGEPLAVALDDGADFKDIASNVLEFREEV